MRRRIFAALAAVSLLLVAAPADAGPGATDVPAQYEVTDVRTAAQRNAVARTGVAIDDLDHTVATVTATGAEVRTLRRLGFTVQPVLTTMDFPPADAAYHNYAEMIADVN
ncbi:MAG: zinc carboxypeptidase, partial [Actinoplanes sp.]